MVSILTVCLNSRDNLERTIKSVISQDYQDFEFIIKDGSSTDGTVALVNSYKHAFELRNIRMKLISCKDKGIADAVMQGLQYCKGSWINLLTAGNIYVNNNVLSNVFMNKNYEKVSVIYGNAIVRDEGKDSIWKGDARLLYKGGHFNTESAFIDRQCLRTYGYSSEFKIASDYDFFLSVFEDKGVFFYIDLPITIFTLDGISSTNFVEKVKEEGILKKNHNLPGYTGSFLYKRNLIIAYIKTFINNHFPNSIKKHLRSFYKKYVKHYKTK